ncbi:MAG: ATP phosphoribosyltransferase [Candidatus Geothermarchaeales archaeon]
MSRVRFAIPAGSLFKATQSFLKEAGYSIRGLERTYRPMIDDASIDLKILRCQEIPMLVERGSYDIGIAGLDWVQETRAKVVNLLDLDYGEVSLVLAVPKTWKRVKTLGDLLEWRWDEGRNVRMSTEYLNITSDYVKGNPTYKNRFGDSDPLVMTPWKIYGENPRVTVVLSFGATEAKPPEDADAILDVTETGTTLEQNNLKAIDVVMKTSAQLIANRESLMNEGKKEKIYDLLALFRGVVEGRKKLHIFVNVKKERLSELLSELPALKSPTVSRLSKEGWYSVNTVIDRDQFLKILPKLRMIAQGLVVYEPRQVMPLEGEGK